MAKQKNTSAHKGTPLSHKKLLFIGGIVLAALAVTLTALLIALSKKEPPAPDADPLNSETPDVAERFGVDDEVLYKGYFEGESADITVTCLSGTPDAYTLEGNVLTFLPVSEDSVYAVAGKLRGNIIIDTGDAYRFDLELHGLSLVCDTTNPILVKSGDEVTITAKKDFENYIYDTRPSVATDESALSGAIHAEVDLELAGKGALTVVSEQNNGIHTKDDLQLKNLTLTVKCKDNALKGNDSVTLESGSTTLIATVGDGIKTANSDISEKGNQRGTVHILGGTHSIAAACDGIDAAYDVIIEGEQTSVEIYTDKYSDASEEVTATAEDTYYLRVTTNAYRFSVKYYNADDDVLFVNVSEDYEKVSSSMRPGGGGSSYYYYTFPKKDYAKLAVYMYATDQEAGQGEDYYACSSLYSVNAAYDTVTATYGSGGTLSLGWTNYTTANMGGMGGMGGPGGGMGGMNEGNSDKGDHSTKGVKAANAITISTGTLAVRSYDDAIHAGTDATLENGASPTGNVTLSGGAITLYSNDDGVHAEGTLTVSGGTLRVENAYEGLEGTQILQSGGYVCVNAKDDGLNSTATEGNGITVSAGQLYIYCTGDGIDSNSRSAGEGICFAGGKVIVISNSAGNSAIDTENGYTYTGGTVLALMPRGGMTGEATNGVGFSTSGTSKSLSLTAGSYLQAEVGEVTLTVKLPCSISSAFAVVLGDKNASLSTSTDTQAAVDSNGVAW